MMKEKGRRTIVNVAVEFALVVVVWIQRFADVVLQRFSFLYFQFIRRYKMRELTKQCSV